MTRLSKLTALTITAALVLCQQYAPVAHPAIAVPIIAVSVLGAWLLAACVDEWIERRTWRGVR